MSSKYAQKQPKKISKQKSHLVELIIKQSFVKIPVCTNCGKSATDMTNRFSKCFCGGTFQTA